MDEVLKYINSLNIDKNEFVVVACSGGPDSIFLLKLLYDLGYNCICAHVNHNVREESREEYKFLQNYCNSLGIIFEGTEILNLNDDNFHNEARIFRYNFFEKVINKYKSSYLFTAHHGDDLMETILMRLVRGSTLKGYRGFDIITKNDDYNIVRPLIFLTKQEIEKLNKEKNIDYVIDDSNYTDHYTRNRYRHHVLPFLKSEDKLVHRKFLNFHNHLLEATNYIDSIIDEKLDSIYNNNRLNIEEFNKLDDFLKREVLERIISYWYPDDLFLVTYRHIDEIFKIIDSDKPNIEIMLPNKVMITKIYNYLLFSKGIKHTNSYCEELDKYISVPTGSIEVIESSNDTSNYTIRLNSKDLKLPLIVRTRRSGDTIKVKNLNGSKKVNDIFIDSKLSTQLRDVTPIVTDSEDNILWIPGIKKSNFDIPFDGYYDIILYYEKKEDDYEKKD